MTKYLTRISTPMNLGELVKPINYEELCKKIKDFFDTNGLKLEVYTGTGLSKSLDVIEVYSIEGRTAVLFSRTTLNIKKEKNTVRHTLVTLASDEKPLKDLAERVLALSPELKVVVEQKFEN